MRRLAEARQGLGGERGEPARQSFSCFQRGGHVHPAVRRGDRVARSAYARDQHQVVEMLLVNL
eukprot:5806852-Pyramimonas_sp.AAC.1